MVRGSIHLGAFLFARLLGLREAGKGTRIKYTDWALRKRRLSGAGMEGLLLQYCSLKILNESNALWIDRVLSCVVLVQAQVVGAVTAAPCASCETSGEDFGG